uniref:Protein F37C4.5 n=1 Tax=Panagrolaimus superbus TaxID=310955 RepID=A0A914Z687_9BILA
MVTQHSIQTLKASEVPIKTVTIFNSNNSSKSISTRAEVTRIFKVSLKPGINEIQLEDIASTIVPNSISVLGQGHATILDVQLQTKDVMPSAEKIEGQNKLKAELKEYEGKIEVVKDLYDIQNTKLTALKVLLNKFIEKPINEPGFNEDTGKSMMELFQFYEKNANELNDKIRVNKEQGKKLEAEAERLKNEIRGNPFVKTTKSYISIEIDSETENECEEAEITLVYQVTGATWMPFYDIRVNTKSDPSEVTIYYYANVQQKTDESWKNVELSLSTAQPCNNETLPKLGTTVVEFISNNIFGPTTAAHDRLLANGRILFGNVPKPSSNISFGGAPSQQSSHGLFGNTSASQQQPMGGALFGRAHTSPPARPVTPPPPPMKEVISVAEENILSTTFTVPKKSTIPSDSSKHKVIIGIKKVAAHLHHECVPKKDAKVFLMATVINTTEYPFLPGIATVYIDNSLSTTFNLTTISPGDKFNCSLGVDKTVKVIYKPTNKAQLKVRFFFCFLIA